MHPDPATTEMNPHLRERIHAARALPSPPVIAVRLIEIAEDPDVGIGEVVEVLRTDPAMSARLLRLANSPLYARKRRTENLRQAVTMLGLDAVITAALSLTLLSNRSTGASMTLSFEDRWTRSVHAAVAAQILAERCLEVPPGDAFLAALVQDIGVLVVGRLEPATYEGLAPKSSHEEIVRAEVAALGVDHAAIGSELLEAWRLPQYIVEAVRNSHDLDRIEETHDILSALVAISGLVADWIGGEAWALDEAADLSSSLLGIDARGFSDSIDEVAIALPDLAPLLNAEVPEPEVLAEMAGDVIMARQMMGQVAVTKLQGELATMANIAAELEAENRIDHVTGLFNRRYLDEILAREHQLSRDHGYPLTVLFLDLDHFKGVNDRFGHQNGDVILAQAGERITSSIRDGDLVGRYGGDEFVIVLPATGLRAAEVVANRLVSAFRHQPLLVGTTQTYDQTVSVGMASTEHRYGRSDLAELLDAADNALYAAKRAGRNGWRSASGEQPAPLETFTPIG